MPSRNVTRKQYDAWTSPEHLALKARLAKHAPHGDELAWLNRVRSQARTFHRTDFGTALLKARTEFLAVDTRTIRRVNAMLASVHKELDVAIKAAAGRGHTLTTGNLKALRGDVGRIIEDFKVGYADELAVGVKAAAKTQTRYGLNIGRTYMAKLDPKTGQAGMRLLHGLNELLPINVFSKLMDHGIVGLPLSKSIWNLQKYTTTQINDVIARGVLLGKDVNGISRDLRPFLVAGSDKAIKTGVRARRGTAAYNANRLARSSLFYARKDTHRTNVKQLNEAGFDYVTGIKWNLSAQHPMLDVCDAWATESSPGARYGPGEYAPNDVPMGHAQDMCHTSDVLMDPKKFLARVRGGKYDQISMAGVVTKMATAVDAALIAKGLKPKKQRVIVLDDEEMEGTL